MTRAEMAAFLIRASSPAGYQPPAPSCASPIFSDVPCDFWAAAWIEELYRRGITTGCAANPLRYCPNDQVINSQMAAFLLRAKEGLSYTPPACTGAGPFLDIACDFWDAPQIAEDKRRGIMTGCGGGYFCPGDPVTRAQMAGYLVRAFDIPVALDPNTPRSIQLAYTQGLLTGVTSGGATYGTISYYPNLMVAQIAHGNGVTETQGNDPYEMRRPSSLAATGAWASWSSGTYAYDGAGDIKSIGTSSFTYDPVSRLVSATLYDGPTGGGNQKQQSYTFDPFGNLTNIAGASGRATPTSAQTNRLNGAGTAYDAAGNLTNWNGAVYAYDAFNQMTRMTSGAENWAYLYTADDERLWSYNIPKNSSRWALRDLGGKVLREYLSNNGRWSLGTDYLYRDGLLLAAETQTGQRHFHLDHLGTPRLITRASGDQAAYHVYYPFGEEATAFNQDTERMKFTGHERDLASPAGAGDDLDYMHARHESPVTGRFLSVDPALDFSIIAPRPQKWNRYAYARDNPLKYTDLSGCEENAIGGGTVMNNSSQDVFIAFDADGMGENGSNRDVVIPLHPGESSTQFTFDADAVIVGEGQTISGAKSGDSFKISAGSVEIVDNKGKKLTLKGDSVYFAMKDRKNPQDRSGHLSESKTPPQWKATKTQAEMEKDREETAKTVKVREKRVKDRELNAYWEKLKEIFRK